MTDEYNTNELNDMENAVAQANAEREAMVDQAEIEKERINAEAVVEQEAVTEVR